MYKSFHFRLFLFVILRLDNLLFLFVMRSEFSMASTEYFASAGFHISFAHRFNDLVQHELSDIKDKYKEKSLLIQSFC